MENTYLLHDETKEAIVIDPGCYESYEKDELKQYLEDNDLKLVRLLNTHGHIDHVLGNYFINKEFGLGLTIGSKDHETLKSVAVYAPSYGFQGYQPVEPESFVDEGDTISFGNSQLEIMFLPGHAPGHIAFYNLEEKFCIGGDVLFEGSIGRTDLPGGDFDTLIDSIKNKLFKLDDDITVHPGHGGPTTLAHEKRTNPFCAIY